MIKVSSEASLFKVVTILYVHCTPLDPSPKRLKVRPMLGLC